MKLRLSYDESMSYCIEDDPHGGHPVEVHDEQAVRWQKAALNWAKVQLEMKSVLADALRKRGG